MSLTESRPDQPHQPIGGMTEQEQRSAERQFALVEHGEVLLPGVHVLHVDAAHVPERRYAGAEHVGPVPQGVSIDELAAALNLTEKLQSVPTELSKGNQQKVQFIAAVVHEPPLLVLDEPFAGFDPINVQVVKGAIRDLVARGTTVMLSSHRMEQVEELCEDICIIDRARAVLSGNLREAEAAAHQHGVIAVGIIADQNGSSVDSGGRRHVQRLHIGHGAGVNILRHERV